MSLKALKESDMHLPVKEWLEALGCEVRSELNHFDMVGILQNECIIGIELKKTLILDVINQAVERQKIADSVYIGVIHDSKAVSSKKYKMTIQTLKRLSIGLFTVNFKASKPYVSVLLEPKPFDFKKSRERANSKKKALIREFQMRSTDLNQAGSSKKPLMTAYRERSLWAAYQLSIKGVLSPKDLVNLGGEEKKMGPMLQKNHYGWFERVKVGQYRLSSQGEEALKTYQALVDFFKDEALNAED